MNSALCRSIVCLHRLTKTHRTNELGKSTFYVDLIHSIEQPRPKPLLNLGKLKCHWQISS